MGTRRTKLKILLLSIVIAILLFVSFGCGAKRRAEVVERVRDSVRTEVRYRTEWRRDTVYLEIPKQVAERTAKDTVSLLETDYALSVARILPSGLLQHRLENKPQKRPHEVATPIIYRDSIVYRDRDNTRIEVRKERLPLTKWQRWQMRGFWLLLSVGGLWLGFRFRRLWLPFAMRLLRL